MFALLALLAFWLLYKALPNASDKPRTSAPPAMPQSQRNEKELAALQKPKAKTQYPKPPRSDMSAAEYAQYLGVALYVAERILSEQNEDTDWAD
mgnify:CR=1 FL=1